VAELAREADRVVCLSQPARFLALGYHYRSFPQLSDEEVTAALREAASRSKTSGPGDR
jgi:putative phosphoribosyl transferase